MAPCSRDYLLRIWAEYLSHREPYVKPTTFAQDYKPFTSRIKKSPQWIETSDDVVDWLRDSYSHDSARRTLQQIKAAFKWAAGAGHAQQNPFAAISNFPKQSTDENHWRAFAPHERAAILQAAINEPDWSRRWITGLFLTGCRPEEQRALRVEDVSASYSQLSIVRAWRAGAPEPHSTKTGATTPDFPVNAQLERLLRECVSDRKTGPLFQGARGGPLNYYQFQSKRWKPLVRQLASDGKVEWYLPQKHTRHTWITTMLNAGLEINTVAYLARNSPAVILRHYAQRQKSPTIPEI